MKKISAIVFLAVLLISATALAVTKIDPEFNYIRHQSERMPASELAVKMVAVKSIDNKIMVDSMIKTNDLEATSKAVEELGGVVKTKLTTVLTVSIPLDAVEALSELEEVVYIEASKKLFSKMNFARNDGLTNVESVQATYDGTGVFVGVVDTGIDCSHPDFLGRIVAFKNLGSGTEFTSSQISAGDCSDSGFHGTHVTGIAAGADSTYKGVAPGSSIVGARLSSGSETEVLDGVAYAFQKAQESLAPAVVNLSLGTSQGAHDGTSTFETGLDELLSGKLGRAIVVSSGNENVNPFDNTLNEGGFLGGIHGLVNVGPGVTSAFDFIVREAESSIKAFVWLAAGSDCSVELDIYPKESKAAVTENMDPVDPGDTNQSSPITATGVSAYVDFTDDNNANNGKQQAVAVITATTSAVTTYSYDLVFRGDSVGCTGHVWLWPDNATPTPMAFRQGRWLVPNPLFGYSYVDGDSNYTVIVPATATGVISVGSYAARDTYVDINGTTEAQNVYDSPAGGTGSSATDISLFSNLGPGAGTANSQKPDITAPGEPIISSLASTVSASDVIKGDSRHVKLEGTSMAAPFVSGTIALLFQKNGCLTPVQVKSALIDNVKTPDAFAPAGHTNTWGWGKIDALAAINSITASTCQPDNPGDDPASSGKGCSLNQNASKDYSIFILGLLFVGLLVISRRFYLKKS